MSQHRSMQGKIVDMEKLAKQHELTPAVGNAKVNARGDKIGPGGIIVEKREDVVSSYYQSVPKVKAKAQSIPAQEEDVKSAEVAPEVVKTTKSADSAPDVVKPTKKEA